MKKITIVIALIFSGLIAKSQYNQTIKIEPLLKTDTTSIGQKIIYPDFQNDEVTIAKITIPPGKSTGWHKHEFPVFAYVLQGNLTVEMDTNKIYQFPANSSFSEVIDTFHNGVNNGNEDVVLIAFFMGGKRSKLIGP